MDKVVPRHPADLSKGQRTQANGRISRKPSLDESQCFLCCLRDQAFKLPLVEADSMLPEARLVSDDMPVWHPAELLLLARPLQHHQERIIGNFFFLFPKPGFQLLRKKCVDDLEVSVACAQLKVESHVQLAGATAGRARFDRRF